MNGPDHYRQAEKFLGYIEDGGLTREGASVFAATATAHATLALVAATFAAKDVTHRGHDAGGYQIESYTFPALNDGWSEVLS